MSSARASSAPATHRQLVAICLGLAVGCVKANDEPLPIVREPAIFDPQLPCTAPPPPPPFQEPAEKPSDPRACLTKSWDNRALPVEMTVVNGLVKEIRFYNQCEGKLVRVEASVRACVESSLKTWRYSVGPLCPGHDTTWTEFVSLRPLSADGRMQGCGGSG